MKKLKFSTIILFIITIVVLFLVLKDDFDTIVNLLLTVEARWIFVAVLCYFSYLFLRSFTLYSIIKKSSANVKLFNVFKQYIIVQFFSGITPFAIGGEPYQVYLLSKEGIKASQGTNIVLQEFIVYQTIIVLLGAIAMLLNINGNLVDINPFVHNLLLLGFIINIVVGIVIIFISFSTKFNKFAGSIVISGLSKFKFIKNAEQKKEKWSTKVEEFHSSAKILKANPLFTLKLFLYNMCGVLILYAIPFLVFKALNISINISLLTTIVMGVYIMLISSFVPIPGGSGGVEYGFINLFGVFITGAPLSAALLIWRTITYYVPIMLGGILANFYKGDAKKCV